MSLSPVTVTFCSCVSEPDRLPGRTGGFPAETKPEKWNLKRLFTFEAGSEIKQADVRLWEAAGGDYLLSLIAFFPADVERSA